MSLFFSAGASAHEIVRGGGKEAYELHVLTPTYLRRFGILHIRPVVHKTPTKRFVGNFLFFVQSLAPNFVQLKIPGLLIMFSYHRVLKTFGRSAQDTTVECNWYVASPLRILNLLREFAANSCPKRPPSLGTVGQRQAMGGENPPHRLRGRILPHSLFGGLSFRAGNHYLQYVLTPLDAILKRTNIFFKRRKMLLKPYCERTSSLRHKSALNPPKLVNFLAKNPPIPQTNSCK